jgi:hypothetical protein
VKLLQANRGDRLVLGLLKKLFLVMAAACVALPAHALPGPLSEQELMEKSDIVALIRVLSVTCTSVTTDERTGEELPGYLARLQVVESKKGDAKKGDEVLVTWRAVPKGRGWPLGGVLLPGRGSLDASHPAQRRRDLCLDLVERQGRRCEGARHARPAAHARPDRGAAARAAGADPALAPGFTR